MKPLPLGADNFSTDSQSILSQPSRRKHNQRKAVKVVSPKAKPSSRRNNKSEKRLVTQSNRPGSQEEIMLRPDRGERRQPVFLETCAREDAQKRSDEQLLLKLSLLAPAKPEAAKSRWARSLMALAFDRCKTIEMRCWWNAANESAVQVVTVPVGSSLASREAARLTRNAACLLIAPKTSRIAGSNWMS